MQASRLNSDDTPLARTLVTERSITPLRAQRPLQSRHSLLQECSKHAAHYPKSVPIPPLTTQAIHQRATCNATNTAIPVHHHPDWFDAGRV